MSLKTYVFIFLCLIGLNTAFAQVPEPLDFHLSDVGPTHVWDGDGLLYGVQDVVLVNDTLVAAVTFNAPVVHLFSPSSYEFWGDKGEGPGEFEAARSAAWASSGLFISDMRPGASRIYEFAVDGNLLSSHTIRDATFVIQLQSAGGEMVFQGQDFGSEEITLYHLTDEATSEILSLSGRPEQRIAPSRGPSLSVPLPFAPATPWALLADGRLATWDRESTGLDLFDMNGSTVGILPLPANKHALTAEHQEWWFEQQFPEGQTFFGQENVFAEVEREARRELEFPETFPRAMGIRADATQGVWVRRTPRLSGEIWMLLRSDGPVCTLQLKPGQRLMRVTENWITTLRSDDTGDAIELYDRAHVRPGC